MIPDPICAPGVACWIPGQGYRVIEDTGTSCALDDQPFEAKYHPLADAARAPVDPYAPLIASPILNASAIAIPPMSPVWPDPFTPCCVVQRPANPLPQLPDVPVPASAGLLLAGLVALAMVRGRG